MSNAVLRQIEEAEREAEGIRASAVREARDMIKAVEEALIAESRQQMRSLAEESGKRVEQARVPIGDEIKSLEMRRGAERAQMRKRAESRVEDACQVVFERIVSHGDR